MNKNSKMAAPNDVIQLKLFNILLLLFADVQAMAGSITFMFSVRH